MKLLLVGASGVLGARLYDDAVKNKWNVLGTYCSHESEGLFRLDLRDRKGIEKIFNFFDPDVVILTAGITDVDLCEIKPKLAEDVNIKGTSYLIRKAKKCGAKLVFLSTDYVFNGEKGPYREEDAPSPVNVYGRTKLEAEKLISSISNDYLIVRTAQLYGADPQGHNFAIKIIQNMRKGRKIYAADDFYSTPTYAEGLSIAILELIKKEKKGIFNIAGTDFISRYDYVNKIADVFDLEKSLIQKVKLKDLRLKAVRPKIGGLKIDKVVREAKVRSLSCGDGLRKLREELEL